VLSVGGYRLLHEDEKSWLQWLGQPRRALMQKSVVKPVS
jgi:hypothetical protein